MTQEDPYAKWRKPTSEAPKVDPYSKWRGDKSVDTIKPVEASLSVIEPDEEEQSIFSKIWDMVNTSIFPDLPEERLIPPEAGEGFFKQLGRNTEEVTRSGYESLIQPMGSALGAGLTVAGGPIARGALGLASKLPGAAKVAGILGADVFKGEAPSFIKKTVEGLTPKGKVSTPVDTIPDDILAPEVETAIEKPVGPVDKLRTALTESRLYTNEQKKLLSAERAVKFKNADKVDVTDEASAANFISKFKGDHTKIVREPIKLEQPDVDGLLSIIGENLNKRTLSSPEGARAIVGLNKLLDGETIQKNEYELLSRIFGPDVVKGAESTSMGELILKGVSIPKALFSAVDLGWPFRQGFNHVGQQEWRSALLPTIQAYISEGRSQQLTNVLKTTRNFDKFRSAGLSMYDDIKLTGDEHTLNSAVQRLPGVKHSNRAFNVGISKMRLDVANTMYDDYKVMYDSALGLAESSTDMALKDELINKAELLNPDQDFLMQKISDLVNTSTGKGSIGKLKPIAEELNAIAFSPALISSRLKSIQRVINPLSYMSKDPVERKHALRQLISMTGTIMTTAGLMKAGGAEVSLNPTSSDFLKGKIGDFRFDLSGGYPQYFVAPAKIISGLTTSAKSGKTTELNSGKFGSPTKFDVLEQFAINKEAPIAGLATSWLRGVEPTGKKVDFSNPNPFDNTAAKIAIPGLLQDLNELYREDPRLLPFAIGSALGGSASVYDDNNAKRKLR